MVTYLFDGDIKDQAGATLGGMLRLHAATFGLTLDSIAIHRLGASIIAASAGQEWQQFMTGSPEEFAAFYSKRIEPVLEQEWRTRFASQLRLRWNDGDVLVLVPDPVMASICGAVINDQKAQMARGECTHWGDPEYLADVVVAKVPHPRDRLVAKAEGHMAGGAT